MFKPIVFIITFLLLTVIADDNIETVDILKKGSYNWDGYNQGNVKMKIRADGYHVLVTIQTCNIGNHDARPNKDYIILKQGIYDGISTEVGKRFAYIREPKKLYFYSSSVILELKVSTDSLTEHCKIIFEKADEQDTTLPPVTTTEFTPSAGPQVSKYSTVFIAGKQIEEFKSEKKLLETLKNDLLKMAVEYTKVEGFCLLKNITIDNVDVYTLEQCPMKWSDYKTCVRLVYSLPITINDKSSLWKGYQLTEEHLDIMWNRMADQYLSSVFHVYTEPSAQSVITWWIIIFVLVIIGFSLLMFVMNVICKRRESFSRGQESLYQIHASNTSWSDLNRFVKTDARRGSEESMSPPEYQYETPTMFGKLDSVEAIGNDNEGFDDDDVIDYTRSKVD